MSSPSIEDYLKAIYHLGRGEPVSTQAIADRLEVTPAAVSKMLRTLSRDNLVQHRKYYGVRLTSKGERIAEQMVRHHRLLERYLVEHLGFDPDHVHEEAEILEHHISERFEDRIAELMGHPTECPHGSPIPPKRKHENAR
ncbi:MAG: metal-dependent transcriptional regulator [Armatimonadetes bacterium]|nr:MAG: metal-dependent transcriptional regulator [Armatimonadota bacterium]